MISFVRGRISSIRAGSVIIEVNGIGYDITVPLSVISSLPPVGEEAFLYTQLVLREDRMLLFGFVHEEELEVFLLLNNISGIGPKVALSLLGVLKPSELAVVVAKENVDVLTRVPGIGKKTAKRIILELKDKLAGKIFADEPTSDFEGGSGATAVEEAAEALLTLGYRRPEALRALREVMREQGDNAPGVEELIRLSLKKLSRS